MFTGRGFAVLAGGLGLWLAARLIGSPDLHIAAVGLVVLAILAAGMVRFIQPQLDADRRLSAVRAFPGARVRVALGIKNGGRTRTSVLLVEDRLPPALGRAARAVLGGIPPRGRQTVSYSVRCRWRGRYRLGPLTAFLTDPFGLARTTVTFRGQDELIVYPEVEAVEPLRPAATGGPGASRARHLLSSGEDFFTMRQYEEGDDLRRIHWPSVARTGRLMIRQNEAARRASATVFLDTRSVSLPPGDPFERAVSAAASIAVAYARAGFSLRLATPDLAPSQLAGEEILEVLAVVEPSGKRVVTPALMRLRDLSSANSALAVVTRPPEAPEIAALSRAATGYGPKLAVLVYPHEPGSLGGDPAGALAERADAARNSLVRAGWEVVLLHPSGRLRDVWPRRARRLATTGAGS